MHPAALAPNLRPDGGNPGIGGSTGRQNALSPADDTFVLLHCLHRAPLAPILRPDGGSPATPRKRGANGDFIGPTPIHMSSDEDEGAPNTVAPVLELGLDGRSTKARLLNGSTKFDLSGCKRCNMIGEGSTLLSSPGNALGIVRQHCHYTKQPVTWLHTHRWHLTFELHATHCMRCRLARQPSGGGVVTADAADVPRAAPSDSPYATTVRPHLLRRACKGAVSASSCLLDLLKTLFTLPAQCFPL